MPLKKRLDAAKGWEEGCCCRGGETILTGVVNRDHQGRRYRSYKRRQGFHPATQATASRSDPWMICSRRKSVSASSRSTAAVVVR